MKMSNWRLGFMVLGVVVAMGFHLWADYLTNPIEGRSAGELSSEMAESIESSISAIVMEIFEKPYELRETSYDLVWNLGVPLLLLLIATVIFGFILYHLFVSIFREENNQLTYIWKGVLSLALLYIFGISILKTFDVLVLNLAVAATVVLIFLFIGWMLRGLSDLVNHREVKE
jgi:hypothetical protein